MPVCARSVALEGGEGGEVRAQGESGWIGGQLRGYMRVRPTCMTCMCTGMCVCKGVAVHPDDVRTRTCTLKHTNTQTHIHTYTHTHTHTHTHGKQARPEHVGTSDMIYIKGHQGEWLTLAGRTRIVFSLV